MSEAPGSLSYLEPDLADRMRKALRVSDLGVGEMAEYLGVSRTSASNWINGRISPSRQTMRLWAMRTGVPFSWLETGEVTENPHPDGPGGGEALLRLDSNQRPSD